jgi:hypothetical protein
MIHMITTKRKKTKWINWVNSITVYIHVYYKTLILIFKVKGQSHRVIFLGEGIRHALRCPCLYWNDIMLPLSGIAVTRKESVGSKNTKLFSRMQEQSRCRIIRFYIMLRNWWCSDIFLICYLCVTMFAQSINRKFA